MSLYRLMIENGSVLGFNLVLYGTIVSALCTRKLTNEPYNLSVLECTPLNKIAAVISIPASLWAIVYAIGFLGFWWGILLWFINGMVICILINFA